MTQSDRVDNIEEFDEWISNLFTAGPTRERVRQWLVDAFWKDQLKGTELLRAFLLSQRGIQMVPELNVSK